MTGTSIPAVAALALVVSVVAGVLVGKFINRGMSR